MEKGYIRVFDKLGRTLETTQDWQIIPDAFDYIIFKDGNDIKAKNGRTGKVDIKSDDLSEVLSEALANSSGRIKILAGEYDAYTPVDLPIADRSGYPTNFGWIIEGDGSYDAVARGTIINLHGQSYWWKFVPNKYGYGYCTQTTIKNLTFKGTGVEDVITHEVPPEGDTYYETVYKNLIFDNVNRAINHIGFKFIAENLQARNITTQAFNFDVRQGGFGKISYVSVNRQYSDEYAIYIGSGWGGVKAEFLEVEDANYGINAEYRDITLMHVWTWGITNVDLRVRATGATINGIYNGPKRILLGDTNADSSNFTVIFHSVFPSEELRITRLYDAVIYLGHYAPGWYSRINIIGGANIRLIGSGLKNSGTATFSGDGTTTTFRIVHGLVSIPTNYFVQPLSSDAQSSTYNVSVDATYITITYTTAPPAGTDNLKFYWYAEI